MNFVSQSILKKVILLFLAIAGLYYGRTFLVPLAIAGLLAALFLPFCTWMESKKINRVLAALLCVLVFLIAISGVFTLVGWQVVELSKDFDMIKQKAVDIFSRFQEFIYTHFGISVKKQDKMMEEQKFDLGSILSLVAGSFASVVAGFILMLVYIVLLLYYRSHLKQFLLMMAPVNQKKEVNQLIGNATEVSHQYLLGLTKMIACLWVMYSIGFSLVGVKNPVFFAVLCGILEIVPFIGNITGTTITVLISAIQGGSFGMIGGIILTYGIVQFIQGWVLEPLIVGPQVRINAFATIVALVAGELIWGIPGIILAIPLTGVLKIVCDHIEPLKPFGFLIGSIKTKKPSWFEKFRKGK